MVGARESQTSARGTGPERDVGSLVGLLRARAGASGGRPVFAYSADGREPEPAAVLTFAALDARARALAAWVQQRDLGGRRVLLIFPPGLEFVPAFFGCLYAGADAG